MTGTGAPDNTPTNGIAYVEVSDDQRSVSVHFLAAVPPLADVDHPDGLRPANVRITGGERITSITVRSLAVGADGMDGDPDAEACLDVTVEPPGDFSCYELCIGAVDETGAWGPYPGFDPRYGCASFSFKAGCPSDLDCAPACPAPPAQPPSPTIDYLAKDYASFRQLILDRMAVTMPQWREAHLADVGVALVEVLAYAADQLSYHQDAVATEAYLGTARTRISVRRHVRLVDYVLHEGLNARAWVTVWTGQDTPPVPAEALYFITAGAGPGAAVGTVLTDDAVRALPPGSYRVFEPAGYAGTTLQFLAAHSEIDLAVPDAGCAPAALPAGATRATLVDKALWRAANPDAEPPVSWRDGPPIPAAPLALAAGDVLVFEEVRGPATGNPADADPAHRQAVRLTRVTAPAPGGWLVGVDWDPADALAFPLCLAARRPAPDCDDVWRVSVARGNVLLVDDGSTVTDPPWPPVPVDTVTGECACPGAVLELTEVPEPITPALAGAPLTFTDPVPSSGPAALAFARDPRAALPQLGVLFDGAPDAGSWLPRPDLLESGPTDRHVVVEMDDDGTAHLRFGDGTLGRRPAAGAVGTPSYRVGNGTAGNVGAGAIAFLALRNASWSGLDVRPRNPLPAAGGLEREPVAEAKLMAPQAFRQQKLRAITAADYAELAQTPLPRPPRLQAAAAELAWTGSWYEARVGVDPLGTETPTPALLAEVAAALEPFRRMGHDLAVVPAAYVPLDVALSVCALPGYLRADVRAALLRLLGAGVRPDGGPALFNPDALTFGGGVRVSALVAAAASVAGVESVVVTRLRRLFGRDDGALAAGILAVGPMEVPSCDNDPDFPEHGRLSLSIGGGR
ncbi:putative baseplate assembly protein [Specibacter cremeus]|uniref:putative baseplate assembly protein n=1 Tax=Specibacter cremeus TaxID=1629051 RepID=UPI000F795866|nr:putative baseplate assembly protein [Specibacter cremeus]